jgi:hypothetical protein
MRRANRVLTVVVELAYLGQVILAAGSLASLRDLADYGATLCFDDAENVTDLKRGDPGKRTLLPLEPWRVILAVAHWLTDCGWLTSRAGWKRCRRRIKANDQIWNQRTSWH